MSEGFTISDNTTFSAAHLPVHAECENKDCNWKRNFSSTEEAENAALRHRCRDEDFMPKGPSIIEIIKRRGEDMYREWDKLVANEGMDTPASKFLQGRLQGVCDALAVMYSPSSPDPDAVAREIQAKCDG